MIPETLFLDQTYISNNTPYSINIEGKLLRSAIVVAQDIHIQPILGSTYYRYITDSTTVLTPEETDLINNFIKPAALHWFLYENSDDMIFKITAASINRQDTQNTTSTSLDELKYIKQRNMQRAEFYTERLRQELCINSNLYPKYMAGSTTEDILPSTTDSVQPGIFFTNKIQRKYDYKTDRFI